MPIALGQVHLLKSVHMILFIVDYMFMKFNLQVHKSATLVSAIYIQQLDRLLTKNMLTIDATSPYPRWLLLREKLSLHNVVGCDHKAHCYHRE